MAFSKTNGDRPMLQKNQYYSSEKQKNSYTRSKQENWSTPKRMASEINNYMSKKLSTANTVNAGTNIANDSSEIRKKAAIIEPHYCLTQVNHNDIRILS